MEAEADGTSLGDVEPGRRADILHEVAAEVADRRKAITGADQGVARCVIHQTHALEVLEVEDEVEARARCVARGHHPQLVEDLGVDLAGHAHRRKLLAHTLTDAVVVLIDHDRLLEVGVVAARERARTVRVHGRHGVRVEATQLGQELEDESPAHHATPIPGGRR